jgi:quinolinate synthase
MSLCLNEKGTENYVDENVSANIINKITDLKNIIKRNTLILGHHYQQDEIIKFADKSGDSFELSKYAAECKDKKFIIFCGVHFMAETADILTADDQIVILPDLAAGCSMADMADIEEVESTFEVISSISLSKIIPVTYMNSSADIKAFVGKNGGLVCTSSNAIGALEWAFKQGDKVLFIPDQHLGRNTAYKMSIPLEQMLVLDHNIKSDDVLKDNMKNIKIFLWKGHCSVHMNFRSEHVDLVRDKYPDINILVHPECTFDVVQKADYIGSTSYIIKTVENAPSGSRWAIGTEHHLVNRLAKKHVDKFITTLAPFTCQCSTMYRISPEALLNTLQNLTENKIINQIIIDEETKKYAKKALQKMLEIPK